jgi:membrane-bound serine protease (ClpP class)
MGRILRIFFLIFPVLLRGEITQLKMDGPIDAIMEEYVVHSLQSIQKDPQAKLVLIQIDTPGGYDSSMRSIIKEMVNSPIPIAVYVSPKGARAASAGFFIAIASDYAAMAPDTNMGAAHPVSVTGSDIEKTMKEKVTNDAVSYIKALAKNRSRNSEWAENAVRGSQSYTAEECLKNQLIDFIAANIEDLLRQIDSQPKKLSEGKRSPGPLVGEKIIRVEMSARQKFLRTITNPNLAYFLLIFGLIGLYIEFTHPGVIIPGILGGISLFLAFLAFQILPINYVGLGLILLSIGLFIAEIKIQGFGLLGVGGIIAFILGSVILVDTPIPEMRPAMSIIGVFALCFGAIFLFLTFKVVQAMKRKSDSGREGIIGEKGIAKTDVDTVSGKVFLHGEWWNAVADKPIPAGAKIQVEEIHNLVLTVKQIGG